MKKLFNADLDKKLLLKGFYNKSGIYCWTNILTKEKYIGSSINLSNRFKDYYKLKKLEKAALKNSSKIYSAILKYDYKNFKVEILEFCSENELIIREQFYINLFNSEYNILKIAGSRLGHKLSEETRKIISISNRNTLQNKTQKKKTINIKIRKGINVKIYNSSYELINEFHSINCAARYLNTSATRLRRIAKHGKSYDNYIYKFDSTVQIIITIV